jgi:hypothetical protein
LLGIDAESDSDRDNPKSTEPLSIDRIIFLKSWAHGCHLGNLRANTELATKTGHPIRMTYKVLRERSPQKWKIIRDMAISLPGQTTSSESPKGLRLVEAWVNVENKWIKMSFITNNFEWSASFICELYNAAGASRSFSSRSRAESADHRLSAGSSSDSEPLRWVRKTLRAPLEEATSRCIQDFFRPKAVEAGRARPGIRVSRIGKRERFPPYSREHAVRRP